MSDANKGTFINPQRMAVLGLHSLVPEQQQSQYHNQPHYHHPESHQQFQQPYGSQGMGQNRRGGEQKDERKSIRRSAVPASTFRGFSYDENYRPRPKKTTTKWGIKPTVEQLRRQAAIKLGVPTENAYESLLGLGLQESTLHDPAALLDIVANTTTPIGAGAPGSANRSLHAQLALAHTQALGGDVEAVRRAPTTDRASIYRVYCGGIPPNCTDQEIGDLFNHVILSVPERTAPRSQVPVRSITNKSGYAFIELSSREDMEIALSMDGIDLRGHLLRVKLPKDASLIGHEPTRRYKIPGLIPTQVENCPHKVFLGNIPPTLDERVIKTILGEFGQLAAFNLVRDPVTNASKRYAFFLLEDVSRTLPTVNALNGFKIGDYVLTCSLALPSRRESTDGTAGATGTPGAPGIPGMPGVPPMPGMPSTTESAYATSIPSTIPSTGETFATQTVSSPMPTAPTPAVESQTHVAPAISAAPVGEPSPVFALHNMATEDMIQTEYDDLMLETREELSNFGSVKSVSGMGSIIYVVFEDLASAIAAANETHGRGFDGRTVAVEYLNPARWEALRSNPNMGLFK